MSQLNTNHRASEEDIHLSEFLLMSSNFRKNHVSKDCTRKHRCQCRMHAETSSLRFQVPGISYWDVLWESWTDSPWYIFEVTLHLKIKILLKNGLKYFRNCAEADVKMKLQTFLKVLSIVRTCSLRRQGPIASGGFTHSSHSTFST